jgi:CysZ protein
MRDATPAPVSRPGCVRRAAAGAWHVPAGFGFLLKRPRLWPLAVLPAVFAVLLMLGGAILAIYIVPKVEPLLSPAPGRMPEWVELPMSLLLWTATVGAGVFLGLGLALLLSAPLLDLLSRRVEAQARGVVLDASPGLRFEVAQSLRSALYFLLAAPGVFLLGFVPVVGPLLSLLWGARAVAFQMTDPLLSRRGLTFADKRRWHREWLCESEGFGLAGMIGLLAPFANLVLGPALIAGGTLLVLDIEGLSAPVPAAGSPAARTPPAPEG